MLVVDGLALVAVGQWHGVSLGQVGSVGCRFGDDGGRAAVNPKMVCGDGIQSVDHASLDTAHTAACRLVNTCVTCADDAVRHG